MKITEIERLECAADAPKSAACSGRREFLTRSVTGGLAIALGGASLVSAARADDEKDAEDTKAKAYELVVKPSDHPELQKVGGFVMLETKVGKVTVARVSETEFSAVGGVCTHKGGPIEYNVDDKQFFCPWHKSKFDLQGVVIKGPAKVDLPHYMGETAAVIKLD